MKKQKDSIALQFLSMMGGHFCYFPAKINNKKAMLLLDTGATVTAFNKEWLEQNFKPGKDIDFVNINGFGFSASSKIEMKAIQLKTLVIGKIKLKKITTTAIDISKIQDAINVFCSPKITIAGVLGNDLLQQLNAVISYKKKRMFFEYNPKTVMGMNMNFDDLKKLMRDKTDVGTFVADETCNFPGSPSPKLEPIGELIPNPNPQPVWLKKEKVPIFEHDFAKNK